MLSCQKHEFSLPEDLHYLNCAYMSPLSHAVEAAGIAGIQRKRVPTDIPPSSFFSDSNELRATFARLINVPDWQRIALVPAVSYGMATVAQNTSIRRGQNIVVAYEQFPSDLYIWRRLCRQQGGEIRTAGPPPGVPHRGERWNEELLAAIDEDTVVVALSHVHWADGTLFDLEAIGRRARAVGAALVIDGTQSVGALPFDVQKIQPDALICAGYKWLFGPYSFGCAYYGPRYDDGVPLEEHWLLRRNSEDFSTLVDYQDEYQPGAARYDVGERSNFILIPMLKAAIEQVQAWRPERIEAYCRTLTRPLLGGAREMGFSVEDEAWRGAHLFGIRLPEHISMNEVRTTLKARNISVSVRGSAIRVSPNIYNDEADMQALLDALQHCIVVQSATVPVS